MSYILTFIQYTTVTVVINTHQRKPKGQSKMNNPEKLAILGTQDTGHTVDSK